MYMCIIPFPNSRRGVERHKAYAELYGRLKDTNIEFVTHNVKQKKKREHTEWEFSYGQQYTDEEFIFIRATRLEFVSERDFLLFQLQFGTEGFGKAIVYEVNRTIRAIERKNSTRSRLGLEATHEARQEKSSVT